MEITNTRAKRARKTFWLLSPGPGARMYISKALEACKAIFSLSLSKNGEVYAPETSCMKGTSVHLGRQRGRVVRASDLKSVGRGFKSRSDH